MFREFIFVVALHGEPIELRHFAPLGLKILTAAHLL